MHLGRMRIELIEAVDDEYVGLQARGRRRHAAAEAQHHDLLASRLDDLGAFVATHPFGHHHFFGVHIFEAVALHLFGRPFDGAAELGRAAEAVADRVCEHR